MEFDKKAPDGGLEITTTVQSGKAYLQCGLHLLQEETDRESYLDLRIWDRENRLVFCASHPLWLGEPLKGLILHPRLWQGTEDPYLYRVRAALMQKKDCEVDVLEQHLALRNLCEIPMKGWFLNDKPMEIRAVAYDSFTIKGASEEERIEHREVQIRQDLQLIREMGANGICLLGAQDEIFYRLCDEIGLLLWQQPEEKIPRFKELVEKDSLTDRYYYYKACWSKEPFVYISRESLAFQENGSIQVTVYSNQQKVALYVDGDLFEFRGSGPDFVFERIPIKQLPLLLTAETRECSMSLSDYPVHKNFTK